MMEYDSKEKKITINKQLNELDKFVVDFLRILTKHTDYVIISGYVSILLGRARATEDIDIFIKKISKENFEQLNFELDKKEFWCLNSAEVSFLYEYLNDNLAIRFARKDRVIPNMEIKFPKNQIDEEIFDDFVIVELPNFKFKISSLERQIAFKRYFLKSPKDIEDAVHIEELFKEKLDYNKINKFKCLIENNGK
ncbi:MAG: hypothetical protein ABIJ18_00425 [archaeon]